MSKARLLADLGNAYDDGALSNRSMVTNGSMQVAQRGTSTTGVNSSGYHTVDRFSYTEGSGGGSGALTMEQSTDAPDGFSHSVKYTVTTSDTLSGSENVLLRTRLEGQDLQRLKYGTSNAQAITLSFWAKSSLTGTYTVGFSSRNTTDSSSIRYYKGYTINATNTWEYKTLTIPAQTTITIDSDNSEGLDLEWMLDSGSDDIVSPSTAWANTGIFGAVTGQVNFMATSGATWQITGVQLEVGDTATPFEHRSYGDELAKCHRYFETTYPNGVEVGSVTGGPVHFRALPSGTTDYRPFSYKVEKRASPTLIAYNGTTGASGSWRGSGGADRTVTLTAYGTSGFRAQGWSLGDYIQNGHFTADAEL